VPRAGLSRAGVVEHALAVVDEAGYDGLTLAAVATRAGVAVPSLYKHVASLADLRREVALAGLRGLTAALTAASVGRSGGEALRALADAYRAFARAHRGRYAATQLAPAPDDAEVAAAAEETVAVVAAVLRGCGVSEERMVDAVRAVRSGLHGFVSLELGGGFGLPRDVDESFAYLLTALENGLRERRRLIGRRT
jgi:AcrR family transcriptional regulator